VIHVQRLIWDDWNIGHISRHEVSPDEVEEVCGSETLVQQGYSGRLVPIGPTKAARILEVVLDSSGQPDDTYYVVTAHPASRKDRDLYQREMGVDEP